MKRYPGSLAPGRRLALLRSPQQPSKVARRSWRSRRRSLGIWRCQGFKLCAGGQSLFTVCGSMRC
eukprot:1734572-Pyramimonas_sp.AAC.1